MMDLVSIDKQTLSFCLPPQDTETLITDTVTINNLSPQQLAFKVKTNNQDGYIVFPNVSLLGVNSVATIKICMHPEAPIPQEPGLSRDKFMLLVAPWPEEAVPPNEFWSRCPEKLIRSLRILVQFVYNRNDNEAANLGAAGAPSPPPIDDILSKAHDTAYVADSTYQSTPPPSLSSPSQLKNSLPPKQSSSLPSPPSLPHVRDLPPVLLPVKGDAGGVKSAMSPASSTSTHTSGLGVTPTVTATTTATGMGAGTGAAAGVGPGTAAGVPGSALSPLKAKGSDHDDSDEATVSVDRNMSYEDAIARIVELQTLLDEKNLELSRLKTEVAETRAETDRVLKDAPVTPIAANKLLSDPFGGVSVAGFGLMLLLFLLVVNIVLQIV